jgi:hypothetical protein
MRRSGNRVTAFVTVVVITSVTVGLSMTAGAAHNDFVPKQVAYTDGNVAGGASSNQGVYVTSNGGTNEDSSQLCAASNLRLTDRGTDVGGGSWIQLFQVTNLGNQSCSLRGYPKISLEPSQGAFHSLVVVSIKYEASRKIGDSRKGRVPTSILSAHGGMASFWIAGSDTPAYNQPGCKMATSVLVSLPTVREALRYDVTSIPFNVCEDQVDVTPILQGRSGSIPLEPLSYFDLQGASNS